MNTCLILKIAVLTWVGIGSATQLSGPAPDLGSMTTLILVRHAEKSDDGTSDPPLTAEGEIRARQLAYQLHHIPLDAIFSTPYQRTRQTVLPTAREKNLEVRLYQPDDSGFLDRMLQEYSGKTLLIAGHSNTIPVLVNRLLGRDQYPLLDDHVYDNLFIASVPEAGPARILRLRFGAPTPEGQEP